MIGAFNPHSSSENHSSQNGLRLKDCQPTVHGTQSQESGKIPKKKKLTKDKAATIIHKKLQNNQM